jgi:TonB-dependent receptor
MRCLRQLYGCLIISVLLGRGVPAAGQTASGTVIGTVRDSGSAPLQGAIVTLLPLNIQAVTDNQGQYRFNAVAPGDYSVSASYVGFSVGNADVTISAGQTAKVDLTLQVSYQTDQVIVEGGRATGEAQAINEIRSSDEILNILPSTVITSLPNANVADAIGRLPGVTLERDEGEGKYVQIRGTEPRLSNLTIDGVVVPSPEGTVRQVKLDTIPAGIVDSVQINKTLLPNMDADAIGGSVNLVTKTAAERPTLSIYGAGGFTPIINTVGVGEGAFTFGQRFGSAKRLGFILSGSYDYNGRGIDDFEENSVQIYPGTTLTPFHTSPVLRQYKYDRNRWGLGSSLDYKLNEASLIYIRGLYSDFRDNGHRWEYTLADNTPGAGTGGVPAFTTERRDSHFEIGNILVGGNHVFGKSWFDWGFAASRSQFLNPINGGESITSFGSNLASSTCQFDLAATKDVYLPQFTPSCFTEAYNAANYNLSSIADTAHGKASQLNLMTYASAARSYHLFSHPSTFEFGFKFRNAHKFDNSYEIDYAPIDPTTAPLMSSFPTVLTNPNYYNGNYKFGPTTSWEAVNHFLASNHPLFMSSNNKGVNGNNFGLVEQITAGYFMNTIDFSRFRLIAGLRIEGTSDSTTSFDNDLGCLCKKGAGSYVNYLPSATLRIRLDNSSDLKLVYSRALNRPDPQTLTASFSVDRSFTPPQINVGNGSLKPDRANNYDVLYERYLNPVGLVQAGFFYKSLITPIVNDLVPGTMAQCPPGIFPCTLNTPVNAGSGYIYGLELAFSQHFAYLPGMLRGLGISANYSYATSQATRVNPLRTDSPAFLRQAPNTWNISPTYDMGRFSIRVGLAYNGPNIFAYAYQNLTRDPAVTGDPSGVKIAPITPTPPKNGPAGDQYLYAHFQVDAQGSFRIRRGLEFIASGLNLNNQVFGFYNGSSPFFIQREYYKPTYTFGFRWEPFIREK